MIMSSENCIILVVAAQLAMPVATFCFAKKAARVKLCFALCAAHHKCPQ